MCERRRWRLVQRTYMLRGRQGDKGRGTASDVVMGDGAGRRGATGRRRAPGAESPQRRSTARGGAGAGARLSARRPAQLPAPGHLATGTATFLNVDPNSCVVGHRFWVQVLSFIRRTKICPTGTMYNRNWATNRYFFVPDFGYGLTEKYIYVHF